MAIDGEAGFNASRADRANSISVDHREVRLCCSLVGSNYLEAQQAVFDPDFVESIEVADSHFDQKAGRVSSTDTTRDQTPMSGNVYEALRDPDVLLQVLQLNQDRLLEESFCRRCCYEAVQLFSRVLPALVIYGGTASLLVCSIWQYRWGVLLSLTLFTLYMVHLSVTILFFSVLGLFRVWRDSQEDWTAALEDWTEPLDEDGDITAKDVMHVVILPTYRTPIEVLQDTLRSLAEFRWAQRKLIVCLAFEEREEEAQEKEKRLKRTFHKEFAYMTATYHPSNLPNHLPGKSSNECWAFQQLRKELYEVKGVQASDPRVVITVMDDDSSMHPKYFEALTYHFITAGSNRRYLQTWQAPICHFKNFLRQPVLVRISSLFSTLSELACLANPLDCHVTYSTYSISLALASAVGGWDPDHLAEDWHMFAKCAVKTEGRLRCVPIFLPVLNYTPEEDGYWNTLCSRWTQAKRHALGVSEVVYVLSSSFLAFLEMPSWRRCFRFTWMMSPLLAKFTQTHFVNGMAGVWNVMAQLVIHVYMLESWCPLHDLGGPRCNLPGSEEQILRNSLLVYIQQRSTAIMAFASIFSGGLGAIYFHMVKDRVEGNVNEHWKTRSLALMWLIIEIEVSLCGIFQSFIFGALPLWIACIRIIGSIRFNHVVVGMVGRDAERELELDSP